MTQILMLIWLNGYGQGGLTSEIVTARQCEMVKQHAEQLNFKVWCIPMEPKP